MTSSAAALEFHIDPSGGAGYRQLRDNEREQLKTRLQEICEQETKISAEEIEIKKGLMCLMCSLLLFTVDEKVDQMVPPSAILITK